MSSNALPRLTFPCVLPRDPLGIPSGPAYQPLLRAGRDNQGSTGWNSPGLKSGRPTEALSTLERAALYLFELDPEVLDIREQFPMVSGDRLRELVADQEKRIPRAQVPTLDIVLTRSAPSHPHGIAYHAVSIKPMHELSSLPVQRRIGREIAFCKAHQWRYSLMTERQIAMARAATARTLCRVVVDCDLNAMRASALHVAKMVKAHPPRGSLETTLVWLARRLGLSTNAAKELVVAAALFGFLRIDLNRHFAPRSPLILASGGPKG